MTKSQIRSYQKELRDGLTTDEKQKLSTAILTKLLQSKAYQSCSSLFAYVSFRSEVNTYEIIRNAITSGKKVYIPRVEPEGMEFYRIDHLDGLIISNFGIPEPAAVNTERFQPEHGAAEQAELHRHLMLLPGLAFDYDGNRIGYGAGYYDRYLNLNRKDEFYKIALAYDFQVTRKIDAGEYDIKVDMIITPTRIIEIS